MKLNSGLSPFATAGGSTFGIFSSTIGVAGGSNVFKTRRNARRIFILVCACFAAWLVIAALSGGSGLSNRLVGGRGVGGGRFSTADRVDAGSLVELEAEPLRMAIKRMDDADIALVRNSVTDGDKNKDGLLDSDELNALLFLRTIQRSTRLLRDNMFTFASLDQHPRDGVVSWTEYLTNFLKNMNVQTDGSKEGVDAAVKALNRTMKEEVMGLKAAWFESVRGDPDRLNIDEFLAFRHPEQSHSFLLKIVEDVSNILDSDGDGQLSLQEFLELKLDDVSMDNFALRSMFDKDLKILYRVIDGDGDGIMTRKELLEYMDLRNPTHSRRETRRLIAVADTNRDGRLSADEMVQSGPVFLACRWFNPDGYRTRFTSQGS